MPSFADADGEAVVGAGQLGLVAVRFQLGDVGLERRFTVVGEGLGEVAVLYGDDEPGPVFDGCDDVAPVVGGVRSIDAFYSRLRGSGTKARGLPLICH